MRMEPQPRDHDQHIHTIVVPTNTSHGLPRCHESSPLTSPTSKLPLNAATTKTTSMKAIGSSAAHPIALAHSLLKPPTPTLMKVATPLIPNIWTTTILPTGACIVAPPTPVAQASLLHRHVVENAKGSARGSENGSESENMIAQIDLSPSQQPGRHMHPLLKMPFEPLVAASFSPRTLVSTSKRRRANVLYASTPLCLADSFFSRCGAPTMIPLAI